MAQHLSDDERSSAKGTVLIKSFTIMYSKFLWTYRQTCHINHTLVGNKNVRHISVLGTGALYIRGLTVTDFLYVFADIRQNMSRHWSDAIVSYIHGDPYQSFLYEA